MLGTKEVVVVAVGRWANLVVVHATETAHKLEEKDHTKSVLGSKMCLHGYCILTMHVCTAVWQQLIIRITSIVA